MTPRYIAVPLLIAAACSEPRTSVPISSDNGPVPYQPFPAPQMPERNSARILVNAPCLVPGELREHESSTRMSPVGIVRCEANVKIPGTFIYTTNCLHGYYCGGTDAAGLTPMCIDRFGEELVCCGNALVTKAACTIP